MLETLPNELLAPIFALACTNGGKTAGALCVASKRIQAAAARHRFHTVAVAGADAIAALVQVLDRTPPELRITKHMFVCDKTASQLASYGGHTVRPPSQSSQVNIRRLLQALVRHAALHVRNLTLLAFDDPIYTRPLAGVSLPQLQVLKLEVPSNSDLAPRLRLPHVRTLHLSMPAAVSGRCFSVIGKLLQDCPALERVCIHGAEACSWLVELLRFCISDRTKHVRCDVYPSRPQHDPYPHLADFTERVALDDQEQNNVYFHEPQSLQWSSHYATWKTRWAETVDSFPCE
jgi:hypothetical protein